MASAGIAPMQFLPTQPISSALEGVELGVRQVHEHDFIDITPLRTFYTVLDVFRWPIENWHDYLSRTNHVATHSAWNAGSDSVYKRFSHLIYIVRDPRDMALSFARFACTPFNRSHRPHPFDGPKEFLEANFSQLLRAWLTHVRSHLAKLRSYNAHIVFYEHLVAHPHVELARLANFLALRLSEAMIEQVVNGNSLERVASRQPDHTNKGVWGGWQTALSRRQIRQADDIAGPVLLALGYPVDSASAENWSVASLTIPTTTT